MYADGAVAKKQQQMQLYNNLRKRDIYNCISHRSCNSSINVSRCMYRNEESATYLTAVASTVAADAAVQHNQ